MAHYAADRGATDVAGMEMLYVVLDPPLADLAITSLRILRTTDLAARRWLKN
jgi:hypothetical protein